MASLPIEDQINVEMIAANLNNCSYCNGPSIIETDQYGINWRAICYNCYCKTNWVDRPDRALLQWNKSNLKEYKIYEIPNRRAKSTIPNYL